MATTPLPLESFADLRSALGKTAPVEKPIVGTVAATEPATATTTPEGTTQQTEPTPTVKTEPTTTTEPTPTDPAQQPTGEKKGPPKRFSEITRERDAEKARADALAAEVATLRAGQTTQTAPTTKTAPAPTTGDIADLPGKPVKPAFADFADKSYEEFEAAKDTYADQMIDYKVRNLRHKEAEQVKRDAARQEWEQVDKTWQQQYDTEMESDDTFETKVSAVAKVVAPKGLVEVIKESPVATEIVKLLHGDAAKLEAIGKMSPASAAREIGKLEALIQAKAPTTTTTSTPAKPLPNPPLTLGGSGDTTQKEKPLGDLPMSEFKERAKKSLKPGSVGLSSRKMTIG